MIKEELEIAKKKKYESVTKSILRKCNSIYGRVHQNAALMIADEWVDRGLYRHPMNKEEGIVLMMKAYEEVIRRKKKKALAQNKHILRATQKEYFSDKRSKP